MHCSLLCSFISKCNSKSVSIFIKLKGCCTSVVSAVFLLIYIEKKNMANKLFHDQGDQQLLLVGFKVNFLDRDYK